MQIYMKDGKALKINVGGGVSFPKSKRRNLGIEFTRFVGKSLYRDLFYLKW